MCEIYTIQLAKWRKAGEGFLDCTLKSGDIRLSPTKKILYDHKYRGGSWEDYCYSFYQHMRCSYRQHKPFWEELAHRPRLVLGCYCGAGRECHRHLLVDILTKINPKAEYCGEIQ